MKKILLLCFCIAGVLSIAHAQDEKINFTSLTTKHGLSSNMVNAVIKDRYGLMWFGTEDGLDKFDGQSFTYYRNKPGDSTSLKSNEILALHEDRSGNLWIGTSGGSLSLYNRQKDAFIHFPANTGFNSIDNNVIRGITSDYRGRIWLVHYNGVDILDPSTRRITNFPLKAEDGLVREEHGICLYEDSKRQMWIGTSDGLWRYDPQKATLKQYRHDPENASALGGHQVSALAEDKRGNLWVGTSSGLSMLMVGTDSFITTRQNQGNASIRRSADFVNALAIDGNKLWIGHGTGLKILNTETGAVAEYQVDHRNIYSLTAESVRCIYIDPQGSYWLGTFRGGVNRYNKNLNLFNYVQANVFDAKGLNASIVTSFAENADGNVFAGTDQGLNVFHPATKLFRPIPLKSDRKGNDGALSILAMRMNRRRQLYIGTFSDGLFLLDPRTEKYEQLLQGSGMHDLNSNDIFCITEDSKGNMWIGTNGGGINVLDNRNRVVVRYTPSPVASNDIRLPVNGFIRDIVEDRNGHIWIGTHGGGLAVLNPSSGAFTLYSTENSTLPNDKVQSIFEDAQGRIWAGTFGGGLWILNRESGQTQLISEKEGLQNNSIYKIVADEKGLLWVSSNMGLSRIDPSSFRIDNFNHHNGIQHNNFVHGSGLRLTNGEMFFGGIEGINYFNPAYLKKNVNVPAVMITGLTVSNQSVKPSDDGPLREHISVARTINLDYKQNFALQYIGLTYTVPQQNQYAYKLEGFDREWNMVGNNTTASYTNLDPGEYVFRVKAANNDGIWNEEGTALTIVVHPPFWRTTYAYALYAMLIIAAGLYARHRGIRKLKKKFALEQEKMRIDQERREAERTHELDQLKIKFLTNISHEFRTPIALILGPVNTLLQQNCDKAGKHLHMIRRNAKRLLNLVNQLLDFRKMEEHELHLHLEEGDLIAFVQDVSDSFKDFSERKKIQFDLNSSINQYYTRFDQDKMERILFNVLSNAFKFTLPGGQVRLELDEIQQDNETAGIRLRIADTGIGIPEDKKQKIFETFYQTITPASILNQGTGIGLSITQEFVKMHGGIIRVDSVVDKGTTFTIDMPLEKLPQPQHTSMEEVDTDADEQVIAAADPVLPVAEPWVGKDLPSVLLVEDNDDFRIYMKDNLCTKYKVLEAANGKEGWQRALASHPHLIVSDIHMPVMDGIALSQKIKADKRTCHIPVILLTALTGEEDQLKGLQTGATDYVTKPFNFELLNAKIRNMLELNSRLKNTYSKQIRAVATELEFDSADEKLTQSIMLYIEENLTNPQLSVEELSRHVGMSRSSLYSKILELTGQTPVEYIRSVKLEKAAVLLEKSDMNIAQVAYSVGFSTPNYFAKSFKAKYNMLPSEYLSKMRKES